ncbi:MAG: T9SS type A sorting domain-containing protein, partial [Candidatus Cloacimonetes bacterium]|nr:T9SS type A sorting domain-containing protein [Candidatus Cloacimonadota bacterium]
REYEKITAGKNKFPPFEENLRCSDSYYVFFEDDIPSMMTGRIPAQNSSEFEIVVNKIINYVQNPDFGSWRSKIILCPDDTFKEARFKEPYHTTQIEGYCADKVRNYCHLDKIYAVEYPFDQSMNKPEVTADLIESINEGSSIFFYGGHGGYFVLGDEDYFRATRDISKLTNAGRLNFFIASSCNVGEFDSNVFQSLSEKYINAPDKGGIAAYSATRGTSGHWHCSQIVDSLVINAKDDIRLGESILMAKGGTISKSGIVYCLLGDPAIKLAIPPTYSAFHLPQGVDSVKVREKAQFIYSSKGKQNFYKNYFIMALDTDYSQIFDYEEYDSDSGWVWKTDNFIKIGQPIYKGVFSQNNGNFNIEFIVPDDAERGDQASLVAYALAEAQRKDAWLTFESLSNPLDKSYTLNGFLLVENPDEPAINIWPENKDFTNGSYTSSSPKILAEISDSNGINITNKPGHRILLTLDNAEEYNVTEYFSYNTGSYRAGSFEYKIDNIKPGDHTLNLKVFDNFNKSGQKSVDFKVKSEGDISVRNVLNYPNPVHKETYFTFYLDGNANVDIKIYTIAGKLIREINNQPCTIGFNKIKWDGLDADGDRPANGLYFYKIKVNSELDDETYKLFIQH